MSIDERNTMEEVTDVLDSSASGMKEVINALDSRAAGVAPVKFWLRDDDAVLPGALLDRLLNLTETYSIPLTMAVIPAMTGEALAQRLADASHVSVAVHGWSHTNYANQDEKKQELGDHRSSSEVLDELRQGFTRLEQLYPEQFVPLLVPPWNRISNELVTRLSASGYKWLSTFGDNPASMRDTGLVQINTQVDIIDWKGSRGGRSAALLSSEIASQIQRDQSSIGILTHHLVHDEAAWRFLEQLFKATSEHAGVRWLPVAELLNE